MNANKVENLIKTENFQTSSGSSKADLCYQQEMQQITAAGTNTIIIAIIIIMRLLADQMSNQVKIFESLAFDVKVSLALTRF